MGEAEASRPGRGRLRLVPGIGRSDVVAGATVALVLIPQSLAYAQLAGMPAHRGLYAAALPPLVAAVAASSPYLQTGPVALTALMTFGALTALATTGSERYVSLGILLALVVGAVRLLVGLARAGVVAYLMSQPMLMGFVPASAILIVGSQLPTALGASPPVEGVLQRAVWTLAHPGSWLPEAFILSLGALALVLAARRVSPLVPAVLLALAVGIAYSELAGYAGPRVGPIPSGLASLSLDLPWRDLPALVVPGVVIALVGFMEPASIARTFAAAERKPWSANREFVSQGIANVATGAAGSFPVGGSFSRSALNRLAGARTRWSGAVTGLVVLAFLPFAWTLSPLPSSVLAAIVIAAVVGLVRVLPLLRLWRYSRPQFVVAWTTFALTIALAPHIERAVVVGIALALAVHLWRELSLDIESRRVGEILELRPTGVLWFGSARILEDAFLEVLARHPDARRLAVYLDGLGRIDLTGALALRRLVQDARRAGLEVELRAIPPRAERAVSRLVERADDPIEG